MKVLFNIILFSFFFCPVFSQSSAREHVLLRLEKEWTVLLDKNDTTALKKLWTEDYVVNNASGKIVSARNVLDLMKAGHKFPKVDRQVEKITFNEDLAVVMGSEIEHGKNGEKKNRRFTNVWRESKGGWKLVARQANGN
ncbi:nuclear transport factor 2 family protein [Pedobacter sp. NJ-S-72]